MNLSYVTCGNIFQLKNRGPWQLKETWHWGNIHKPFFSAFIKFQNITVGASSNEKCVRISANHWHSLIIGPGYTCPCLKGTSSAEFLRKTCNFSGNVIHSWKEKPSDLRYQNLDEQKLLRSGWNPRQPDFTSSQVFYLTKLILSSHDARESLG